MGMVEARRSRDTSDVVEAGHRHGQVWRSSDAASVAGETVFGFFLSRRSLTQVH